MDEKMENTQMQIDNEPFYTDGCPEIRSIEGGGTVVYGYAALYNVRSLELVTKKGVKFVEEILPGAFDGTDFRNLKCFFDHDRRDFLASEPTLRYGVDERGLWYEYDHDPADPTHMTALRRIQRRNAQGSSFQFPPLSPDCYTVSKDGGVLLRTISKIPRVVELGPVITPAYRGTTTFARSLDQAVEEEELETQAEAERRKLIEQRKLQVRATLM